MTEMDLERHNTIETLRDLIQGMSVAMLTTLSLDGKLRSRPMIPARHDFDGDVWFFTLNTASQALEAQHHSAVNVSYATPAKDEFLTLSGTADIVTDRQKMELLWKDELHNWFAEGLSTPGLVLLRVAVEEAECWGKRASTSGSLLSSMISWKGTFELVHKKIDWTTNAVESDERKVSPDIQ